MLNRLATHIQDILEERPGLKAAAGLRIRTKGQDDADRLKKFIDYKGPDANTLKLLEHHFSDWNANPSALWVQISPWKDSYLEPQAYPVRCYLSAIARDNV